jgi:hypothetical protein
MFDGFVAAITAPLEYEADGDHILVTLKSGRRKMAVSISRCDLFASMCAAKDFIESNMAVGPADVVNMSAHRH